VEEALRDEFDAAIVCTPSTTHAEISIHAMQAGLHVLTEKPIADTVENAQRMGRTARETGKVLMVGYMTRFHPGIKEMKRRVDEGRIGQLLGGHAMLASYYTLTCARTHYRMHEKGGLVLDFSHEIDYLRWFFGEVVEVTARSRWAGDLPMKPEPNMIDVLLTYRSGAVVSLHLDYIQHPERRIFELYGDKGTLVINLKTSVLEEYLMKEEKGCVQQIPHSHDNLYIEEHDAFFQSIKDGIPAISAEEGIKALRIARAVLLSAELRAPIKV
jgi:predicted dehydrogenase